MKRRDALKQSSLILGGVLGSGGLATFLQGCKVDNSGTYTPLFLSGKDYDIIASLTEVMLPKTDRAPSGVEVGVPQYLDVTLANFMDRESQEFFQQELVSLNERCQEEYGNPFYDMTEDQRQSMINKMATEASSQGLNSQGKNFFMMCRSIMAVAYLRSEEVAKNVTKLVPVPGKQEGCVSVMEATGGVRYSLNN